VSRVLKHCCLHDPDSHIHLSHFLVVCSEVDNTPVACASAFPYPEFSIRKQPTPNPHPDPDPDPDP
jgi:hypothetical protein